MDNSGASGSYTCISPSNSVIFMPNGGSGFTASQTGSTSVSLNANQYTRTGMSFTGWNTKADGSGTQYADGATFNLSSSSNMLFAQWASIPPALTCNWKPSKIGSFYISAKGIVSGSTYYSNSALFKVRPRSNPR